jgi:hypothetical protein
VSLRVTVTSNAEQGRLLKLRREAPDAEDLPPRWLALHAGEPATVALVDTAAPADRAAVYVASLDAGDAFPENDRRTAAVLPERHVVAWVAADGYRRGALEQALKRDGLDVRALAPAAAPRTAVGWADYAAVVTAGPSRGRLLADRQADALAAYVRGGGGWLQIGTGPHATPADRRRPLNRAAALVANPYQRKPLKVVVVLDASGSMNTPAAGEPGRKRFDLAVESVMDLQRHLTDEDALAVVAFANVAQLVYDSGSGPADFGALHRGLKAIRPSGRTVVLPALATAAAVPLAEGRDGLVLLASDLKTEPFDPDEAAGLFRAGPYRLAMVVTMPAGETAPEQAPLRALAQKLGIAPRPAEDLAALAGIFVDFLSRARGEALRQGEFRAAAPGGGNVLGVSPAALPPVRAYFLSAAQEGAEVLLRVGADPLLASRRVGLGRTVSLALPIRANEPAPGGAPFDALLAAAVRTILRSPGVAGFDGAATRRGELLHVAVTAAEAARLPERWPVDGLSLTATVQDPAAEAPAATAALLQTAPGRYEAEMPLAGGAYGVAVRDGEERVVWRGSVGASYAAEFGAIGPASANLRRLAALTGGRVVRTSETAALARAWDRDRLTGVWQLALAAALALMLIDWAATRIWRRE